MDLVIFCYQPQRAGGLGGGLRSDLQVVIDHCHAVGLLSNLDRQLFIFLAGHSPLQLDLSVLDLQVDAEVRQCAALFLLLQGFHNLLRDLAIVGLKPGGPQHRDGEYRQTIKETSHGSLLRYSSLWGRREIPGKLAAPGAPPGSRPVTPRCCGKSFGSVFAISPVIARRGSVRRPSGGSGTAWHGNSCNRKHSNAANPVRSGGCDCLGFPFHERYRPVPLRLLRTPLRNLDGSRNCLILLVGCQERRMVGFFRFCRSSQRNGQQLSCGQNRMGGYVLRSREPIGTRLCAAGPSARDLP